MRKTKRTPLALISVALILAGCDMVGPEFQTPKTPEVKQWLAANSSSPNPSNGMTARSAPSVEWWKNFNDATLNQLIADAYAQNLSLQVAGALVYQARSQLGIAAGEIYPQSQAIGASVNNRKISENLQFVSDIERFIDLDTRYRTSQVGFDASWEIDVWGGIRRNIESAQANVLIQVANYDDALITVTGDVAATYINIRALQAAIAVMRRNIELQQETLDLTQLRFNDGVATELDVEQAKAFLYSTQSKLPALESDLRQSKNALAVLLSLPPGGVDARLGSSTRIPTASIPAGVGIPAELLRRRPDVRAAEMEAAAQSAQIGVAIAALYPSFGLTGNIGWQASSGRTLFSPESATSLIQAGVNWNVLNYDRLENNVRSQDAAYQALVANYQNTVLVAYSEVENAMAAYKGARSQVSLLSQSAEAAQKAADIALLQYRNGVADYQRVIDAQRALLLSEASLIQARSAVSENLVALYKALGGGWEIREGREFLPNETLAEMAYRTDWGDVVTRQ